MAILNIDTSQTGQVSVLPSYASINTNDTEATVLTTGYLNREVANGATFNLPCIAKVSTVASPGAAAKVGWYNVSHSGTNWSLTSVTSPGSVVLPTIADHFIASLDVNGTLGNYTGTLIQNGSLQAGTTTVAGSLISTAGTANGSLQLKAVSNAGVYNAIISNASLAAQSTTFSIPDPGATTANFLLSAYATTQHITSGSLAIDNGSLVISEGDIVLGQAAGGVNGNITMFPAGGTDGAFLLAPVGNVGGYNSTISPSATLSMNTVYSLADPDAMTANIAVTGGALVSGNLVKASGTAGVLVDSGIVASNLASTATVSFTSANITGMYATPVQILAAPGSGKINIIDSIQWDYAYSTAAYSGGGLITAQYGTTDHAGGTICTLGIPAATLNGLSASGQLYDVATSFGAANTVVENAAIYLSNASGAFTTGSGTVTLYIRYRTVTPA